MPIFDTGLVTCEASERILAVCTGSGELRTYDVRASNRPVTDTQITQKQMMLTHILKSPLDDNYLYTITQEGHPIKLDRRKDCRAVRKMVGSKGSIRDAKMYAENGVEYLLTGGCDRYMRVFDATRESSTTCLVGSAYLK